MDGHQSLSIRFVLRFMFGENGWKTARVQCLKMDVIRSLLRSVLFSCEKLSFIRKMTSPIYSAFLIATFIESKKQKAKSLLMPSAPCLARRRIGCSRDRARC